MDTQRLEQFEKFFLTALERERFFKVNCSADDDLRCKVESLLAFEENPTSLLDQSPQALAAEIFTEEEKK
jgi:hypothetical protein